MNRAFHEIIDDKIIKRSFSENNVSTLKRK